MTLRMERRPITVGNEEICRTVMRDGKTAEEAAEHWQLPVERVERIIRYSYSEFRRTTCPTCGRAG